MIPPENVEDQKLLVQISSMVVQRAKENVDKYLSEPIEKFIKDYDFLAKENDDYDFTSKPQ